MTVPFESSLSPSHLERRSCPKSRKAVYITWTQPTNRVSSNKDMSSLSTQSRTTGKNFTNNDYLWAIRARELQVMVGRPSDKDLIRILKTSSLPNCPITPRDVHITNELFGPDVRSLKRKTTRQAPPIVDSPVPVDLTTILKHYGEVTLCIDLMYVNKVPLLVTLLQNIKFGTMEAVADRKEATILKCIKGVVTLYRKAGFKVTTALMDGEFIPFNGTWWFGRAWPKVKRNIKG